MKIFGYQLDDGGTGVVFASNAESAEATVREAYAAHGGYEGNGLDAVEIDIFDLSHFDDFPMVYEVVAE